MILQKQLKYSNFSIYYQFLSNFYSLRAELKNHFLMGRWLFLVKVYAGAMIDGGKTWKIPKLYIYARALLDQFS